MKKISSAYGISGIFKGQVATFTREAVGYGAYFWAYEMLVQKWVKDTHRKREELPATYAVLYGAAAGYAVRVPFRCICVFWIELIQTCCFCVSLALGLHLPNRCRKVEDTD